MIFKEIFPRQELKEFVNLYRLRHFVIPRQLIPSVKPYPAQPEQCFIFYPRGSEITQLVSNNKSIRRSGSLISGQYTQRLNRSSGGNEFLMIMVVLKPGVLYRLTGIPLKELLDQDIELEAIFPRKARLVDQLLNSCASYSQMIAVIENLLLDLLTSAKIERRKSDVVFDLMCYSNGKYSLDWLAKEACLSVRQFERIAGQYLGICPKHYSRLARFHHSYRLRLKNPHLDWLSIALSCGYSDYQHLVKDYKEFANTTPNLLFQEEYQSLERQLGIFSQD